MKNSILNSNREKQYMCYQNTECMHKVKNTVLHPPFSESQPEKEEKEAFFVGSTRTFF